MRNDEKELRLSEEPTSTPMGLLKIGWFAGFAFLLMAAMVDPRWRAVPLVTGGGIVGVLILVAVWLSVQNKYGSAWLVATSFTYGHRFEGVIETELMSAPAAPLSVRIYGWHPAYNMITLDVRDEVSRERVRQRCRGKDPDTIFGLPTR
jgi:hypothetical protein